MNNNTETIEQKGFELYPKLIGDPYRPFEDDNKENRDIWIDGANWQKEHDEAKYKALLDSHNELLKQLNYMVELFDRGLPDGSIGKDLCNESKQLINKAKNI